VSRVWRKVKADWEAWNARSLAEEPILILDDTAVRARITEEIAGQTWAWGRLFHSPG
jgi:transposase-like protein